MTRSESNLQHTQNLVYHLFTNESEISTAIAQKKAAGVSDSLLGGSVAVGAKPQAPVDDHPITSGQSTQPRAAGEETPAHPQTSFDRYYAYASWYTSHKSTEYRVTVYEGQLECRPLISQSSQKKPPKRTEGDIRTFSKKSRKRLIDTLNTIQSYKWGTPIFCTLTVRHDRSTAPERCLDAFERWKVALRKSIGPHGYVWKLEPHKSGYPHLHVIVWPEARGADRKPERTAAKLRQLWLEAIGDADKHEVEHAAQAEVCDGKRKVRAYLAKYISKSDGYAELMVNRRRWGRSYNMAEDPIAEYIIDQEQGMALTMIAKNWCSERGGPYDYPAHNLDTILPWTLYCDLRDAYFLLKQVVTREWLAAVDDYIDCYATFEDTPEAMKTRLVLKDGDTPTLAGPEPKEPAITSASLRVKRQEPLEVLHDFRWAPPTTAPTDT